MKSYKYSKVLISVICFLCYLFAIGIMMLLDIIRKQPIVFDKSYFIATMVYIFAIATGIGEYSNRSVKFDSDIIQFDFVRVQSVKVGLKARSYRIAYSDIWRISADTLPIIGVYRIRIYGKNLPAAILIDCFFEKHKELFENFYHICLLKNPNTNFDEKLVDFIESRSIDEKEKEK